MEEKVTVGFHYARGGQFHNAGYCYFNAFVKSLSDCFDEDDYIVSEDEKGNTLPDDQWQLIDGGGNIILEGRGNIEAETGVLDYDGEYDTWVVKNIEECNQKEKDAIYKAYCMEDIPKWVKNSEEIKDYAVEQHGEHRIHDIKFYQRNATVFTSDGIWEFSWDGMDDDDEVFESWKEFFNANGIDRISREYWLFKCNRIYFND